MATPTAITGIDIGSLAPSGKKPGRCSSLSTMMAENTNNAVNAPKIVTPIGVELSRFSGQVNAFGGRVEEVPPFVAHG